MDWTILTVIPFLIISFLPIWAGLSSLKKNRVPRHLSWSKLFDQIEKSESKYSLYSPRYIVYEIGSGRCRVFEYDLLGSDRKEICVYYDQNVKVAIWKCLKKVGEHYKLNPIGSDVSIKAI